MNVTTTLVAFSVGFVIATMLTVYIEQFRRKMMALADPSNVTPAERTREQLRAGRHRPPRDDAIETEIVAAQDGALTNVVELRAHPTFVAAVRYLLTHPAVRSGDFGQIVITNIDEREWSK